jgi:hypothetical protein
MQHTHQVEKLYLTNRSALQTKYGASGVAQISLRLADLVAADAQRGMTADIGFLDHPPETLPRVSQPDDDKTTKDAFDAWYSTTKPDYVVIVGGSDVVCYQPLTNPLHVAGDPSGDPDATVPSDLPYACAAPHSRSIDQFIAPSRVVGRLPDYPGPGGLDLFLSVLDSAAVHTPISPPEEANALLVSAERWKVAAEALIFSALGRAATVHTSPTEGPLWTHDELARQWHLFSCHGASATPAFYGEDLRGAMPESHLASHISGRIAAGTVCITGCCYGAQLYPPSLAVGVPGICFAYLGQQAATYVGSTNIAYGQDDIPFGCDEFSGYVLAQLAIGSSAGMALLGARQSYLAAHLQLSPFDQKTLAQFVLYGDPSIHPLGPSELTGLEPRQARRQAAVATADGLSRYAAPAVPASPTPERARDGSRQLGLSLAISLAAELGLEGARIARFEVLQRPPPPVLPTGARGLAVTPSPALAYYVALGRSANTQDLPAGLTSLVGLEVAERQDGTIDQRIFRSRGWGTDGVILRPSQKSSNR